MKPQAFALTATYDAAAFRYPVSEGVVNRFGMSTWSCSAMPFEGSHRSSDCAWVRFDEAIARLLKSAKWTLLSCPFYFKVNHPFRFLREIAFLRRRPSRRLALDALAFEGSAGLASTLCTAGPTRTRRGRRATRSTSSACVAAPNVDRARSAYAIMAIVRDARTLNRMLSRERQPFPCPGIEETNSIGWAILMITTETQLGAMRFATLVDCLAVPGEEPSVVSAATVLLEEQSVDLIVTNQLHASWGGALEATGWSRGPSNFILAAASLQARNLAPLWRRRRLHMTR